MTNSHVHDLENTEIKNEDYENWNLTSCVLHMKYPLDWEPQDKIS